MATRKNLNKNAISAFEEYGVSRRETPRIAIIKTDGPPHKPVFYATAWLGSREISTEEGASKHEARNKAAERALQTLHLENTENSNGIDIKEEEEEEIVNPIPYKDPVSALTEFAQTRKTSVSFDRIAQEGLPHMPIFSMQAKVGDKLFDAVKGSSVKEAKKKAACLALMALKREGLLREFFPDTMMSTHSCKPKETKPSLGIPGKNPISVLNEYAQKNCLTIRYEYEQAGPSHKPLFRAKASLFDKEFEVVDAPNKKEANRLAAEKVLNWLLDEGKISLPKSTPTGSTSDLHAKLPSMSTNECHADRMDKITMSKIEELLLKTPESLVGRKVVAAIVMLDNITGVYRVVSIGSGNRCIKGDRLTETGQVIHDSHAEILARRAFKRYLYRLLKNGEGLIEMAWSGKYRFMAHISFHLYISTAPCGDGALFTHSDQEKDSSPAAGTQHKPVFDNKRTQGLLRAKQENGEGTIPIERDFPGQTYDGIKQGGRLQIMSCSDKICQWNVVGVQGALLSNFYEPVYLKSVTLGNLYHQGHLSRSLCCRIDHQTIAMDKQLPEGFNVNHPDLACVSGVDDPRAVEKSKSACLNWNMGESEPEITDGPTGETRRRMDSLAHPSRLCKLSFMLLFKEISNRHDEINMTYKQLKMKSDDYNQAKMTFQRRMHEQGYGNWIPMPREVDRFVFKMSI